MHKLSNKWSLKNLNLFKKQNSTNNLIYKAYSEKLNKNVILKKVNSDITDEKNALEYFNDIGSVKLLDFNTKEKELLLEEIVPGTNLKKDFNTQEELLAIVKVVKKLHFDRNNKDLKKFKSVNPWIENIKNYKPKNIKSTDFNNAIKLASNLIKNQKDVYLLHGDLHHENILKNNNHWISIDPQGIVGELELEITTFLMNPVPELLEQNKPEEIILKRINYLAAELNLNKQKILDWLFVKTILCICWAEQDNSYQLKYFLNFLKLYKKFIKQKITKNNF